MSGDKTLRARLIVPMSILDAVSLPNKRTYKMKPAMKRVMLTSAAFLLTTGLALAQTSGAAGGTTSTGAGMSNGTEAGSSAGSGQGILKQTNTNNAMQKQRKQGMVGKRAPIGAPGGTAGGGGGGAGGGGGT
jgi:hypothetical protein